MNRWNGITAVAIAIFAVRGYFNPTQRWWAIWGIILVAGGICLHRNELAQEKRAQEKGGKNESCWAFYLAMVVAFLAGGGWALYHKLGGWSILFAAGSSLIVFVAFICNMMGTEKPEDTA